MKNTLESTRLSDDEKNALVLKYQKIVFWMANRYRFFDPEIEEVQAWCFLGLAKAINTYEENPDRDFPTLAFPIIKTEIYSQYKKKRVLLNEKSLDEKVLAGKDGKGQTLGELLPDNHSIMFDENDIQSMVEEAIFEESVVNQKIILDWLLTQKELEDIAKEHTVSLTIVKRTVRRGQILIKQYLVNNDIILDYLNHPSQDREKPPRKCVNNKISPNDYGKIKYIKRNFPYLSVADIATLLDTSSLYINELLNYRPTTYISAQVDESIGQVVLEYVKNKYPERIPGEVVIQKNMT